MAKKEPKIKYINTTAALKRAAEVLPKGISLPTMIRYCEVWGIGIKIGGRWQVDAAKLEKMLAGEDPNE